MASSNPSPVLDIRKNTYYDQLFLGSSVYNGTEWKRSLRKTPIEFGVGGFIRDVSDAQKRIFMMTGGYSVKEGDIFYRNTNGDLQWSGNLADFGSLGLQDRGVLAAGSVNQCDKFLGHVIFSKDGLHFVQLNESERENFNNLMFLEDGQVRFPIVFKDKVHFPCDALNHTGSKTPTKVHIKGAYKSDCCGDLQPMFKVTKKHLPKVGTLVTTKPDAGSHDLKALGVISSIMQMSQDRFATITLLWSVLQEFARSSKLNIDKIQFLAPILSCENQGNDELVPSGAHFPATQRVAPTLTPHPPGPGDVEQCRMAVETASNLTTEQTDTSEGDVSLSSLEAAASSPDGGNKWSSALDDNRDSAYCTKPQEPGSAHH